MWRRSRPMIYSNSPYICRGRALAAPVWRRFLPKGWEEEVREILDKAGDLEKQSSRSGGRGSLGPARKIGNPVRALGDQVYRRLATPKDMAVSGALVIAAALALSITPLRSVVSPVLAIVGGILLVGAYVRTLMGRHSSSKPGTKMWRGRVIDIEGPRKRGFFDRIRGWRDRHR